MSHGKIILNYGDYLVRESEIELIKTKDWLNDVVIGFYFEYLSLSNVLQSEIESISKIKFFGPEVTQCIKMSSPEDIPIFLGDTELQELFFWPLNNSVNVNQQSGGSHWSLLVFSKKENIFWHFDSAPGANREQGQLFAKLLAPIMSNDGEGVFTEFPKCEYQSNTYDCGLHVICNAEKIARHASKTGKVSLTPTATASQASQMRVRLIEIIEKLAKNE